VRRDLVGAELRHRDHQTGAARRGGEALPVERDAPAGEGLGHHERRGIVHGDDQWHAGGGGDGGRRRVHEVDGRDPPDGAGDAEHVPGVVEHGRGQREDHRPHLVERVGVQRPVDVGAGMARGERGHVDAEARQ
jgi:hypothetical protein